MEETETKSCGSSTTEAEFVSTREATRVLVWLKNLLGEIGETGVPVLFMDNQSCIRNSEFHLRTKYIGVKHNFVRWVVEDMFMDVEYVPSEEEVAEISTKGEVCEVSTWTQYAECW